MRRLKIFWILLVFILFILPKQGFSETSLEKEWWYEKLKELSIEEKLKNGFPDFDYIRALIEFEEKYIVKDKNIKRQIFEKVRYKVLNKIKKLSASYPENKFFKDSYTYCLESGTCGTSSYILLKINKNYYLADYELAGGWEYAYYIYDINNDQLLYWIRDKYYGNEDENLKFILKIISLLVNPDISCPLELKRYCGTDEKVRSTENMFRILNNKNDPFTRCYFSLIDSLPRSVDTLWIRKKYIVAGPPTIIKIGNKIFISWGVCKIHACNLRGYSILYEINSQTCYGQLTVNKEGSKVGEIIESKKYWLGNVDNNTKLLFKFLCGDE